MGMLGVLGVLTAPPFDRPEHCLLSGTERRTEQRRRKTDLPDPWSSKVGTVIRRSSQGGARRLGHCCCSPARKSVSDPPCALQIRELLCRLGTWVGRTQ